MINSSLKVFDAKFKDFQYSDYLWRIIVQNSESKNNSTSRLVVTRHWIAIYYCRN